MDAVLTESSPESIWPCVVCNEPLTSKFGARSLVKTTCSEPHQLHLQCVPAQMSELTGPRRCFVCQEPAFALLHDADLPLSVYACRVGDLDALQTALALEPTIVTQDYQGDNLLTIAAQHGHDDCLKELINSGADVNQARGSDGVTPLYVAAKNGHSKCLNTLLDKGANINVVLAPELGQDTVIDILCNKASHLLTDNLNELRSMFNNQSILNEVEVLSDQAVLNAVQHHTAIEHGTRTVPAFTSSVIRETVHVINGELAKLKSLDMVLAVVGTLKAGKSTTINAIVGAEILPKRNRAMTAIPTLIRYAHEQNEPVLRFSRAALFNNRLKTLREKLHHIKSDNYPEAKDPEIKRLLYKVRNGYQVNPTCTGTEAVREYLRNLNNLAGLFAAFAIDFSFEEYGDIDNMPVIDVRFASLCDIPKRKGQLALLDTPGINEAGQSHNRPMIRNILRSSSAVLAVVDYTQISSDASAQLGQELQHVARATDHNISVWMNKFDQCDDGCDGQEASKEMVVEQLFNGNLNTDHVYPVSSRAAFLAHRALRQLEQGEAMPATAAWVKDFGHCAFGVDWEEAITDQTRAREKAEKIWTRSLYRQPLARAIQATQATAHILAFKSVMAELTKSTTTMIAINNACHRAATVREQSLAGRIDAMNTSIDQLNLDSQQAEESISQLKREIKAQIEANSHRARLSIERRFDAFIEQIIQEKQRSKEKALAEPYHHGKRVGASAGEKAGMLAGVCTVGLTMASFYGSNASIATATVGALSIFAGGLVAVPAGRLTGKILGGGIGGGVSLYHAASLYARKVVSLRHRPTLPEGAVISFPFHEEARKFNARVAALIAENRIEIKKTFLEDLKTLTEQLALEMRAITSRACQQISKIKQSGMPIEVDLPAIYTACDDNCPVSAQLWLARLFDMHMKPDIDYCCISSGSCQVQPGELVKTLAASVDQCWEQLMAYTMNHLDKRITELNQPVDRARHEAIDNQRYHLRHVKNDHVNQQALLAKLTDRKNKLARNTIKPLERAIEWLRYQQSPPTGS